MPFYDYKCEVGNHFIEKQYMMGYALRWVVCDLHQTTCERHYSIPKVIGEDEFRKAYLSSKQNERQWADLLAPHSRDELKAIQEKTGRIYMRKDDDYSKMQVPKGSEMESNIKKNGTPWKKW